MVNMKLPAPINGDLNFHKFMVSYYVKSGLSEFAKFHAQLFNELQAKFNKNIKIEEDEDETD